MDGCEILHQLIGGKHPIFHRLSTILLVVQDFFPPLKKGFFLEGERPPDEPGGVLDKLVGPTLLEKNTLR